MPISRMVTLIISLASVACWPSLICAQTTAPTNKPMLIPSASPTPEHTPSEVTFIGVPDIEVEPPMRNLGVVNQGEKPKFEFTVRNVGQGVLNIQRVRGSCGCTKVRIAKKTLAPGESTKLTGEFDTKGRRGGQSKNVYILSNDPDEKQVALKVRVKILVEVYVIPPQLYFNQVDSMVGTERMITITGAVAPSLELREINVQGVDFVTTEVIERKVVPTKGTDARGKPNPPETQINLLIKINPTPMVGPFLGNLELVTNSTKQPKVTISVRGNLQGDLEIMPTRLYFGVMQPDSISTRTVILKSKKGEPVKVLDVDLADAPLTWSLGENSVPGQPQVLFELTAPIEGVRHMWRDIKIRTDHPDQPIVSMTVVALVRNKANAAKKP